MPLLRAKELAQVIDKAQVTHALCDAALVEELSAEFRALRQFATLSPIPGLRRWLDGALSPDLFLPEERAALLGRERWFDHRWFARRQT